jgi:hypothetical protein
MDDRRRFVDDQRVAHLYRTGATIGQISERLQFCRSAITQALRRSGISAWNDTKAKREASHEMASTT